MSLVEKNLATLGHEKRDPGKFLEFLRRNVTIEALLADRNAQAQLLNIMDVFVRKSDITAIYYRQSANALHTPYPVLHLKSGSGTSFIHEAFRLKGDRFFYYFSAGWPEEKIPPYLRPEDVVPSGRRAVGSAGEIGEEIPFNKPIHRVPVDGGLSQRYNYNTQSWENSGGIYSPEFSLSGSINALARRVMFPFQREVVQENKPKLPPGESL